MSLNTMDGGRLLIEDHVISPDAHNEQQTPVSSLQSKTIVLLGKTGVGKSAAGNTILGMKMFESELSLGSVTSVCVEKHTTLLGRSVSVIDTPGFFDTNMKQEELKKEIGRAVYLSSPGPHAFLIVFRVNDRFTEQEQQIPQKIERMFGHDVLKYSFILFTYGDNLKEMPIETLIESFPACKHLVNQCGGRFHVFNNNDENNRKQVNDLLQKIDMMIEQNGGHYSNEMYKDAQKFRQREEERIQREENERKQQKKKQREEEIERAIKETEERVRAESQEFTAFCSMYDNDLLAAAAVLTVGIIVPFVAAGGGALLGVVGTVAAFKGLAAGAVVTGAAVKGLAIGAAVGGAAVKGLAIGAAVGGSGAKALVVASDGTQRSQRKKQKKKQQ